MPTLSERLLNVAWRIGECMKLEVIGDFWEEIAAIEEAANRLSAMESGGLEVEELLRRADIIGGWAASETRRIVAEKQVRKEQIEYEAASKDALAQRLRANAAEAKLAAVEGLEVVECEHCFGVGQQRVWSDDDYDPRQSHLQECPFCLGTGKRLRAEREKEEDREPPEA